MKFINKKDFKMLWVNDKWDGMLAGVCEVEGKRFYIKCLTEESKHESFKDEKEPVKIVFGTWDDPKSTYNFAYGTRVRVFGLYELTEEEWREEDYWHEEFCKYVGSHNDLRPGKGGKVKPRSMHHKFYDRAKKKSRKRNLTDEKLKFMYTEVLLYD
jgi:hypothetical protein